MQIAPVWEQLISVQKTVNRPDFNDTLWMTHERKTDAEKQMDIFKLVSGISALANEGTPIVSKNRTRPKQSLDDQNY